MGGLIGLGREHGALNFYSDLRMRLTKYYKTCYRVFISGNML